MTIELYDEVNPGSIFPPSKTVTNFTVALVNDLIGQLNSEPWIQVYNIVNYGASPSASPTVNRIAIQAAIDACAEAGGGIVFVPPGEYLVEEDGVRTAAIFMASNVWLCGAGKKVSSIKLADNEGAVHVISVPGTSGIPLINWQISNLGIDGNRANNSGAHGIRIAWVINGQVDNCWVHDTGVYGIGAQAGTLIDLTLSENLIEQTGHDGIDIKNHEDNNKNTLIKFNTIIGFGQDGDAQGAAGIDCRGKCRVIGNSITDVGPQANTGGIRAREGDAGAPSGDGGHFSIFMGNYVELNSTSSVSFAINARHCTLTGNISYGPAQTGFRLSAEGSVLSGCIVSGATGDGFELNNAGVSLSADNCSLSSCSAFDCGGDGFQIETKNNRLIGCGSYNNANYGFWLSAAAEDNGIIEWHGDSNGIAMFIDGGSRNATGNREAIASYEIAVGIFTLTAPGLVFVDTEGLAATDDLNTINGGRVGWEITLCSVNSARVTTLKDGTGNLRLASDFALSSTQDTITLIYTAGGWLEKSRSDNA